MANGIRTKMEVRAVCSECGEDLEADSERSGIGCGSGSAITASLAIKPCRACYWKAQAPARLIQKALAGLKEVES